MCVLEMFSVIAALEETARFTKLEEIFSRITEEEL